jgi:hypothetical protein
MSNTEEQLMTVLDECLAAMRAGESIEKCLTRYPDHAGQLAPLLRIAVALEQLPQPGPSLSTAAPAKVRFLNAAEQRRASAATSLWDRLKNRLTMPGLPTPVRALATAAVTLALVVLIGGGVIYASSGSLPGDPLYGFKLLGEDIRLALTFSHDGRIRMEETFTEHRRDEVRQLLAKGRQESVAFGGLLRSRSNGDWLVEDIPVTISTDTRLQADPALRTFVEIHGVTLPSGTVLAALVEIEGAEIIGLIENIAPHRWHVAGLPIQVDDRTHIEAGLRVGDCVEAHTRRFDDDTLLAMEIERTDLCHDAGVVDQPTPTPTTPPTATPSSTATASPTATAGATGTPTLTRTPPPTPTATADATHAPRPTETPSPSPTVTPMPFPTVTSTPTSQPTQIDDEPTPTVTPQPTEEDDDGDATATPRPTDETKTPKPTDDHDDDETTTPEPTEEEEGDS